MPSGSAPYPKNSKGADKALSSGKRSTSSGRTRKVVKDGVTYKRTGPSDKQDVNGSPLKKKKK